MEDDDTSYATRASSYVRCDLKECYTPTVVTTVSSNRPCPHNTHICHDMIPHGPHPPSWLLSPVSTSPPLVPTKKITLVSSNIFLPVGGCNMLCCLHVQAGRRTKTRY